MRKKIIYFASVVLSIVLGASIMYGVIYFFPNTIVKTISENKVSVTDEGISEGVGNVYDAVVVVESLVRNTTISIGTGFVYKIDGDDAYVMTNHHVIEDAESIQLTFTNDEIITAELVGSDEYADIAILKIDKNDVIQVANISSSVDMEIGDTVFTIGTPLSKNYAGTVTRGIISGKNRMVSVSVSGYSSDWIMNVMQTDAAINPGNSGGPLCNVNGDVIGINSLKIVEDEIEGLGFSIPIEDAIEIANHIESGTEIIRPYLGISMLDLSASYDLMLAGIRVDGNVDDGVVVYEVENNSPAADSGLEIGDIITEIGDSKVSNIAEFRYNLYKYEPGETVTIKFYRDGEYDTVKVELEKNE